MSAEIAGFFIGIRKVSIAHDILIGLLSMTWVQAVKIGTAGAI
jgi:hypothetical protein